MMKKIKYAIYIFLGFIILLMVIGLFSKDDNIKQSNSEATVEIISKNGFKLSEKSNEGSIYLGTINGYPSKIILSNTNSFQGLFVDRPSDFISKYENIRNMDSFKLEYKFATSSFESIYRIIKSNDGWLNSIIHDATNGKIDLSNAYKEWDETLAKCNTYITNIDQNINYKSAMTSKKNFGEFENKEIIDTFTSIMGGLNYVNGSYRLYTGSWGTTQKEGSGQAVLALFPYKG